MFYKQQHCFLLSLMLRWSLLLDHLLQKAKRFGFSAAVCDGWEMPRLLVLCVFVAIFSYVSVSIEVCTSSLIPGAKGNALGRCCKCVCLHFDWMSAWFVNVYLCIMKSKMFSTHVLCTHVCSWCWKRCCVPTLQESVRVWECNVLRKYPLNVL